MPRNANRNATLIARTTIAGSTARTVAQQVTTAVLIGTGKGPDADRPWETLMVGGRPFLEHVIERLRGQGVTRILVHAATAKSAYTRLLGSGERFGVEIRYIDDVSPDAINRMVGTMEPQAETTTSGRVIEQVLRMMPANELPTLGADDETVRVTNYRELYTANIDAVSGAIPGLSLPRSRSTMCFVAEETTLARSCFAFGDCMIGANTEIGAKTALEDTVVLPGTRVGPGLSLRGWLVDGPRLVRGLTGEIVNEGDLGLTERIED